MGRCDRGRLEDVRDSVIVLFCFIYVVFFSLYMYLSYSTSVTFVHAFGI